MASIIAMIPFGFFICEYEINHSNMSCHQVFTGIMISNTQITIYRESEQESFVVTDILSYAKQNILYFTDNEGNDVLLRQVFRSNSGYEFRLEYDRRSGNAVPKNESRIYTWFKSEKI